MGPKKKGKNAPKAPPKPEIDPKEEVTELQRQFFEIQLDDIEMKIGRLATREEEMKLETAELEEKLEEFKREKGAIIAEHEELLAMKEEEKIRKREEMIWLSNEIKVRVENHKKHIEELEERYNKMVEELTEQLHELEEEVRVLEEFKQNKNLHEEALIELEMQMKEDEMQHQRNLFEIDRKWEMAKVRVKKGLESRLLDLSIEFQQTTQKSIGTPCHRVTHENKAIENEIRLMREDIEEYEEKYEMLKSNVVWFKSQEGKRVEEKDKALARTIIQKVVRKALLKDRQQLLLKLQAFVAVDAENKVLLKKLRMVTFEIDKKVRQIEDVTKSIEEKIAEINSMKESSSRLKKKSRKLQILSRNALKVAEEAVAVRLIPIGGTEEEKYMTMEAKFRLFRKRRDLVFQKKGRILHYLLDLLSNAQLSEEDKKLLVSSTESIDIDIIDFALVYGTLEIAEEKDVTQEEKKSVETLPSDASLPRSISEIQVKKEESGSSMEEEDRGEFDEELEQPAEPAELPKEVPAEDAEEAVLEDAEQEEEQGSVHLEQN